MKQLFEIRFFFSSANANAKRIWHTWNPAQKHMHIIIENKNARIRSRTPTEVENKQRLFNAKNWNIHYVFCEKYLCVVLFVELFYFSFSLTQWSSRKKTQPQTYQLLLITFFICLLFSVFLLSSFGFCVHNIFPAMYWNFQKRKIYIQFDQMSFSFVYQTLLQHIAHIHKHTHTSTFVHCSFFFCWFALPTTMDHAIEILDTISGCKSLDQVRIHFSLE